MGTHYTNYVTDIRETNRFASWAAITNAQLCDGKRPILIFSGLSGMTLGMSVAMALLRDRGIEAGTFIVRKPEEVTRSGSKPSPVTRSENTHFGGDVVPFFIDDGIDAGTTYNFCMEKWRTEYGVLSGRPDAIPVVCKDWINPYNQHLFPPSYRVGDTVHTEYDKRVERKPGRSLLDRFDAAVDAASVEIPAGVRAPDLFEEMAAQYRGMDPKTSPGFGFTTDQRDTTNQLNEALRRALNAPPPMSYFIQDPRPPAAEEKIGAGGIPPRDPPRKLGFFDIFPAEWLGFGKSKETSTLRVPREGTLVLGVDLAGPQGDYSAGTTVEDLKFKHPPE